MANKFRSANLSTFVSQEVYVDQLFCEKDNSFILLKAILKIYNNYFCVSSSISDGKLAIYWAIMMGLNRVVLYVSGDTNRTF